MYSNYYVVLNLKLSIISFIQVKHSGTLIKREFDPIHKISSRVLTTKWLNSLILINLNFSNKWWFYQYMKITKWIFQKVTRIFHVTFVLVVAIGRVDVHPCWWETWHMWSKEYEWTKIIDNANGLWWLNSCDHWW